MGINKSDVRISKSIYPFAMSLCPTTELQVALLISDGRALIWTVEFDKVGVYGERLDDELMNKDGRPPLTLISALPRCVSPLVSFGEEEEKDVSEAGEPLTLQYSIAPHWFVPPDDGENTTCFFITVCMRVLKVVVRPKQTKGDVFG